MMIAESGIGADHRGRLATGKLLKEMKLRSTIPTPTATRGSSASSTTAITSSATKATARCASTTATGKVVWEYEVPLFGRKPKGGHGPEAFGNAVFGAAAAEERQHADRHRQRPRVLEVTPEKKIVWKIEQNDLPGITLAWVTTLQVLPNGNYVIGNCHAGPASRS